MRQRIAATLLAVLAVAGCATSTAQRTDAPGGQAGGQVAAEYADLAPTSPTTDLPTIAVADLPPQGVDTLELIEAGGPFPYDKDGSTFQNREGILPRQPGGFYAEYTVETPGSDDRGARRIVAGDDGSRFYTEDHYASFEEVVAR
jgi:ribonuclease T1